MRICVIGCGRWGSLITWYLDSIGHEVTLYGRADSQRMRRFLETRENDLLRLPEPVALTTELSAVKEAETVIISVNSQGLQVLMDELRPLELKNKTFAVIIDEAHSSTAGSAIDCVKVLKEAGAEVLGIVSIFTYGMQKGLDRLAAAEAKFAKWMGEKEGRIAAKTNKIAGDKAAAAKARLAEEAKVNEAKAKAVEAKRAAAAEAAAAAAAEEAEAEAPAEEA